MIGGPSNLWQVTGGKDCAPSAGCVKGFLDSTFFEILTL